MASYFAFASNVPDFEGAEEARRFSGPLDSQFSTPSIPIEPFHPIHTAEKLEQKYGDHPVFKCQNIYVFFYDEKGDQVSYDELCKRAPE